MSGGGQLISVYPEELSFEFELDKPSYCNLKVVNNTEHHVAFKVKTTSPKKYFVRPNTSVIQPWDSCTVTVNLQPQNEYPPDMQSKDKFLLQCTKVPPSTEMDELPPDTFNKDGDKVIEELKLRVVYMAPSQSSHGNSPPQSSHGNSEEDSGLTSPTSLKWGSDNLSIQAVQHLREERDAILEQNQQLQRELVILKRRRNRKSDAGFSLTFTAFSGLAGLMVGFILNFMFSSPPTA